MTPNLWFAAGFEKALDRCLRLDPDLMPRIAALADKVIAVEAVFAPGARGASFAFFLLPGADGVQVEETYAGDPDVLIRGTPLALVDWARGGAALAAEVQLQGDIDTGKAFQEVLRSIDLDWEEQLSHWIGDFPAHKIGKTARGLQAWGGKALDTLLCNAAEYFQQEARDLPSRHAVRLFLDATDQLKADADRLEARIRRLQQSLDKISRKTG